jgi:hypothetical protein
MIVHFQELGQPKHINDILDWENQVDDVDQEDTDSSDSDDADSTADTDSSDDDESSLKISDIWSDLVDDDLPGGEAT